MGRSMKSQQHILQSVGHNIYMARKELRISQATLGERVHKSYSTISLYENGGRPVPIYMLFKLAAALSTTPEALIKVEGLEEIK